MRRLALDKCRLRIWELSIVGRDWEFLFWLLLRALRDQDLEQSATSGTADMRAGYHACPFGGKVEAWW